MAFARFPGIIDQLPFILDWIHKQLIEVGMNAKETKKIELASEEAIVNIIRHAYEKEPGEIEVRIAKTSQEIEISLIDQGPPFDPLISAPPVDLTGSLSERKEGGLGIYFMRQCLDDLRYRREKGANVLTLVKRFSQRK